MKNSMAEIQNRLAGSPDWTKKLAVGLIFLGAVILAQLIARKSLAGILIAGAILTVVALLFFIRHSGIAFPLVIIASLLIPLSISTGTQTRINSALLLVMLLVAAWLVKMAIVDRQLAILPQRSVYAALAFIVVCLVAFGFGQLDWYASKGASLFAQIGQVLILTMSAAAFLLAAHRMQNIRWFKTTVYVFIALGGAYILAFMLPPLRHYANLIFQRAVQDSLFWTWLIALAFGQFLVNRNLKPFIKISFLIVALAGFFTVTITKQSWVSGWLPVAAALFVILLLTKPKAAIVAAMVFVIILLVQSQIINNYIFVGDNQYSMSTRLEAWKILFQIIAKNPLFGVGPANYYFYTPYYNILGYSVSFNSHNNYIDIIAQTGLVGIIVFFWWMIEIAKVGFSLLKKPLDCFENAFVVSAIAGLAGTLVAAFLGDWFLPFVYNIGMDGYRASVLAWIFLGGLLFIQKKNQTLGVTN